MSSRYGLVRLQGLYLEAQSWNAQFSTFCNPVLVPTAYTHLVLTMKLEILFRFQRVGSLNEILSIYPFRNIG